MKNVLRLMLVAVLGLSMVTMVGCLEEEKKPATPTEADADKAKGDAEKAGEDAKSDLEKAGEEMKKETEKAADAIGDAMESK